MQLQQMLKDVIAVFEQSFPDRIRGYYVEGSYADESNVGSSDIDVLLVFKDSFEREKQQAEELARRCAIASEYELDIEIDDEVGLMRGAWPTFKFGSRLVYGEDMRDRVPLIPLQIWTRDRMHSSYWRTVQLMGRHTPVSYPLNYPDATSEFLGYERRKVRLADGREVASTRDLIRLCGWSATAIIAYKARRYVARKRDCHRIYQESFQDQWGQLLQDIYEKCRGQWNYLIPEQMEERAILRSICERTLGFENHFLQVYKEFVLTELRDGDEQRRQEALLVLEHIPFGDEDVLEAIARAKEQQTG